MVMPDYIFRIAEVLIGYPLLALLISFALTRALLPLLQRVALMDIPNDRSNHTIPVPRGGGIAVMAVVIPFWLAAPDIFGVKVPEHASIALLAFVLMTVSLMDDFRSISPLVRLSAQTLAVTLALPSLQGEVFQGLLPHWLDMTISGIAWLWFINLFNFMDGIDGITGVETISIAGGIAIIALLGHVPDYWFVYSSVIVAAAMGFLWWNWHPARLFLGDVGSVPLGFLLGFLLLQVAAYGYPAIALILPAYYFLDATLTLLKRIAQGHKPWKPHSTHFYQQAVRKGWSHSRVSVYLLMLNVVLLVIALLTLFAVIEGYVGVILAISAAAAMLGCFRANNTIAK